MYICIMIFSLNSSFDCSSYSYSHSIYMAYPATAVSCDPVALVEGNTAEYKDCGSRQTSTTLCILRPDLCLKQCKEFDWQN